MGLTNFMKAMLITTLIGLLLVALTGLLIERLNLYQDGYDIGYGDGLLVLPSVADIQRRIGAKPDGIVGKETLAKWDAAICQQYANIQNRNIRIFTG